MRPVCADPRRRVDQRDLAEPVGVRDRGEVAREPVAVGRAFASRRTSRPPRNSPESPRSCGRRSCAAASSGTSPRSRAASGEMKHSSVGTFIAICRPQWSCSPPPRQSEYGEILTRKSVPLSRMCTSFRSSFVSRAARRRSVAGARVQPLCPGGRRGRAGRTRGCPSRAAAWPSSRPGRGRRAPPTRRSARRRSCRAAGLARPRDRPLRPPFGPRQRARVRGRRHSSSYSPITCTIATCSFRSPATAPPATASGCRTPCFGAVLDPRGVDLASS